MNIMDKYYPLLFKRMNNNRLDWDRYTKLMTILDRWQTNNKC